jgi:hypothetical protein
MTEFIGYANGCPSGYSPFGPGLPLAAGHEVHLPAKILKYRSSFCIKHGAKCEMMLDAGLWILDLREIYLIYPASSIKYPASTRLKQADIDAAKSSI